VLSFLGSFAQFHEGNRYPTLIRESPTKPLRVFLQAGTRDLNWDAPDHNWLGARFTQSTGRPLRPAREVSSKR
jgi:hypothetical protein